MLAISIKTLQNRISFIQHEVSRLLVMRMNEKHTFVYGHESVCKESKYLLVIYQILDKLKVQILWAIT